MTIESPSATGKQAQRLKSSSSTAAWLPWVVVGALTAIVVLTLVLTDNSATVTEPTYPSHQLDDPLVPWVFTYVFPAAWMTLFISFAVQTARKRTFSMPALLFLAGTTMFWIEWPFSSVAGPRRGTRPTGSRWESSSATGSSLRSSASSS